MFQLVKNLILDKIKEDLLHNELVPQSSNINFTQIKADSPGSSSVA
jgi:hypothetical protein